ncbi:helix-turn-helix domain-containing protein [Streptomyces olivaceiscleroticus]|uniref:Helix-turn-helix domain-containing protein n=1 Tax=Streptomyces olivaceiscleroticus TaxID=68245 RepID=A0ABN0ZHC5_9ACTN
MQTVFDSSVLSPAEAFGAWEEVTRDEVMPTRFRPVHTGPFSGRLEVLPMGAVRLAAMRYALLESRRTPRMIRQSDPELYQIAFIHSGLHVLDQARQQVPLRRGQFVLYDSSRAFTARAAGESMLLQFPRCRLPLPAERVEALSHTALPFRAGMGRLLADFLTGLADESASCTAEDAERLGAVCLEMVAAVLAHQLGASGLLPPETRQQATYQQVLDFIRRNLHDASLRADTIAAAHHISLRTLQRLFQHTGGVRNWIREQRLEACRRDLASPDLCSVPVQAIAARWGFPRPADFARAFRARYGTTPSDYRDQARRPGTGTGAPGQDPGAPR